MPVSLDIEFSEIPWSQVQLLKFRLNLLWKTGHDNLPYDSLRDQIILADVGVWSVKPARSWDTGIVFESLPAIGSRNDYFRRRLLSRDPRLL